MKIFMCNFSHIHMKYFLLIMLEGFKATHDFFLQPLNIYTFVLFTKHQSKSAINQ